MADFTAPAATTAAEAADEAAPATSDDAGLGLGLGLRLGPASGTGNGEPASGLTSAGRNGLRGPSGDVRGNAGSTVCRATAGAGQGDAGWDSRTEPDIGRQQREMGYRI